MYKSPFQYYLFHLIFAKQYWNLLSVYLRRLDTHYIDIIATKPYLGIKEFA